MTKRSADEEEVAEVRAENKIFLVSVRQCAGFKTRMATQGREVRVFDVTSRSKDEAVRCLSPFTACSVTVGDVSRPAFDVPFLANERSYSVEGVWQGLKVFEREGIDRKRFRVKFSPTSGSGGKLKRGTSTARGRVLGHYAGEDRPLLEYAEARQTIYLPLYREMLDKYCGAALEHLLEAHEQGDIALVDYTTNADVLDTRTPLAHASLVKERIHQMWAERHRAAEEAPPAKKPRIIEIIEID